MLGYQLFPHKTSKGYSPAPFSVVTHVNGKAVRNLAHWSNAPRRQGRVSDRRSGRHGLAAGLPPRRDGFGHRASIFPTKASASNISDDLEKVWHRAKP